MSAFGQHAETEIRLNALSARITQLEALIREVAIPVLKMAAEWNWMDHDLPKEIEKQHDEALTKLREAIK